MERTDLHGDAFCAAMSVAADLWLTGLLERADGAHLEGLGLMAVGGYGRGELCPYSDLDVVMVHDRRLKVKAIADAVWYPVWDEGIRLDHSVRQPKEVLQVAASDLRAVLGLLDGRLVAGDGAIVEPLPELALENWRSNAERWLPVLARQIAERHLTHGDVAFLLEPDLKEAHGGLRDVHAVTAAARAVPAVADQVDLASLDAPRRVLTAARVELHRTTGRATDRLLLQEQDQVAAALAYADADALMAAIAEAGRTIAWVADDLWRRESLWATGGKRRFTKARRRRASPTVGDTVDAEGSSGAARHQVNVEPGIVLIGEDGTHRVEVALDTDADVQGDVTLGLRLAAVAAERGLSIARPSLDALAQRAPAPPDVWPDALRQALVRVLATGPAAITALEALDQRGLVTRLLPEWAAVRNRPQRNAFHRFTVDRHLLEAASQASALTGRVERPDLLLVGALLHDIGKGFPGDHTTVGIDIVGRIARRMGFALDDVEVLVSLVRNHLLLPDVATRRDLDDPATVAKVVEAVGSRSTLELLAALTEADSLATGPAAWGPWKAGLVADLVQRASARLSGAELPARVDTLITDRHRRLIQRADALGRSVVAAEAPSVIVVARDRPGLLATVTGVLALRGLDVRSADVAGEDGFAVEVFVVEPNRGRWPDFELVGDELEAALRGTLPLEERLADQARVYAGERRPATAHPPSTSVTVDNAASASSTVIELRSADGVGLLHRVTTSLFELNLDVTAARVSTFGHEVVDAFYVCDKATGGKLADEERIAQVEQALFAAATPVSDQL